ncbi:threonine synthase [Cutibacterium avidum]|uniref:threonine synthase n=1 Tax=Cutibacterium avidum TaxID=33010 RepID=UPI0003B88CFF|nr:threonine synthase [Cutibacterium avidum]ERS24443.1 threonine synthase [Propionibacterium sp. KPL2005]ERS26395.1 threonine synthase [Propionibacterium sp. KPL2000]ERS36881.1 threonine synthase [Propionibacterium sp. KPL1838]ERS65884.1 threonine synthase [Propionibacterium sp. KPL1852]
MTRQKCPFGVIENYRDRLPMDGIDEIVTLGEGSTPLVPAPRLGAELDSSVWIKVEGSNPTGSFKDRGMTMAMTKALADGSKAVVCASTGNTSASASAYATRAGMTPVVLLPQGKIAAGKLAQAVVHGGRIIQVLGNFDDCLRIARELAENFPVSLVNSVNPYRIEGQKTAAFEIVDVLGDAPDIHALPVGNAGNITAYWKGYGEYAADGPASHTPRMFGFQASGAAPLVLGHDVDDPETMATAIRIGRPASGDLALAARDESNGLIEAVTDEQILDAQAFLAAREGIFVEPASATGVAGLLKLKSESRLEPGQRIVITVTGNGLKDIDTALSRTTLSTEAVEASTDKVAALLDFHS